MSSTCQFQNLAGKACTYGICGEIQISVAGEMQGVPFYLGKAGKKITGSSQFCNRHKKHEKWWPRCQFCNKYKVDSNASGKTKGSCQDCIDSGAYLPEPTPAKKWATVVEQKKVEDSEAVKAARAALAAAIAADALTAAAIQADADRKRELAQLNIDNRAIARQYVTKATDDQIRALVEYISAPMRRQATLVVPASIRT